MSADGGLEVTAVEGDPASLAAAPLRSGHGGSVAAPPAPSSALSVATAHRSGPPKRRGMMQRLPSLTACWPYLAVMAAASLVRIVWPASSDVFGDEVYYIDLSTSMRQGHYPPHFLGQGVFLLHPPLFFIIGAAWQTLGGPPDNYFSLVDWMRLLVALFAVATAVLVALLTARICNWRWGVAAGTLFALEPYALRTNGRVLLETPALAFVLAGYLALLAPQRRDGAQRAARARPEQPAGVRHPRADWSSSRALQAVAAGLLMGLGIITVELAAIITIGPLIVVVWRGWCLPRRYSTLALGAAIAPYAIYLVSLAATHHLGAFVVQDSYGLRRALGLIKSTGFSAPGAPSLVTTLLGQIWSFGTTYLLVGLGVLYGIYPLLRGSEELRLIGTVVLFGALAIGYEVALGTIEEQFLYVLLVPAIVAIACAGNALWSRHRQHERHRRVIAGLLALLFLAIPLYDIGVWAHNRSRPDNGLAVVVAYLKRHATTQAVVGTNVLVATYVLGHEHIDALTVTNPRAAARSHVAYLVILSAELQPGYGAINMAEARTFEQHGRLLLSRDEATYGEVLLYRSTDSGAW